MDNKKHLDTSLNERDLDKVVGGLTDIEVFKAEMEKLDLNNFDGAEYGKMVEIQNRVIADRLKTFTDKPLDPEFLKYARSELIDAAAEPNEENILTLYKLFKGSTLQS
jgi:hypothetical protein